ncbi:MAG: permease [Mobilitalea sp.]
MTKILKKSKENIFLILVVLGYAVMFFIKPQMSFQAAKNSGYYIKEMLMIMPVIFILTALLDTWVPKQTIIKYFGQGSKFKGTVLSFALGAISAGPIYAAFPICLMLHKKGATIKNIVIILSSWAVIKIPMLLNEVKFLGPKFMIVRWILTVIAILIFSWIASKIVKDADLPKENEEDKTGLIINQDACMGCSLCVREYTELFEMKNKKAYVKDHSFDLDKEKLKKVTNGCPVNAIEFNEK